MCFTVSYCYLLSLTVLMELMPVSHCLSGPMELLHASHWWWPSLTVSPSTMELLNVFICLFQFHEVAACLLLSPMVAGSLSLSQSVPFSC